MEVNTFVHISIWIFVTLNFSIGAIILAQKRQGPVFGNKPLPDLGHELLFETPQIMTDVGLLLAFLLLFFWTAIPSVVYVISVCVVYMIRAITICVTSFPPPSLLHYGSTADLMYSGHTVAFWAIADLLDAKCGFSILRSFLLRFIGPLSLISSRQHYTCDVLVSCVIMYLLPTRSDCLHENEISAN